MGLPSDIMSSETIVVVVLLLKKPGLNEWDSMVP